MLKEHYSLQIITYCKVWETLMGEKVKGGEIFFTSLNESYPVYTGVSPS